jgi:hypothetical protein
MITDFSSDVQVHATHFRDQLVVRNCHGHGPEQRLQVVRQFGPSAVALPGGVERDEDARVAVDGDGLPQESDALGSVLEGRLETERACV